MVWLFPLSVVNNVFALLGFAGCATLVQLEHRTPLDSRSPLRSPPRSSMFGRIRQLIVAFFVYNVVNVVVSFHVFVDVANAVATVGLHGSLTGYERAAAAFLFFDFLLSLTACVFGIKALDEVRSRCALRLRSFSVRSAALSCASAAREEERRH
jgi:hypothetical protein